MNIEHQTKVLKNEYNILIVYPKKNKYDFLRIQEWYTTGYPSTHLQ